MSSHHQRGGAHAGQNWTRKGGKASPSVVARKYYAQDRLELVKPHMYTYLLIISKAKASISRVEVLLDDICPVCQCSSLVPLSLRLENEGRPIIKENHFYSDRKQTKNTK